MLHQLSSYSETDVYLLGGRPKEWLYDAAALQAFERFQSRLREVRHAAPPARQLWGGPMQPSPASRPRKVSQQRVETSPELNHPGCAASRPRHAGGEHHRGAQQGAAGGAAVPLVAALKAALLGRHLSHLSSHPAAASAQPCPCHHPYPPSLAAQRTLVIYPECADLPTWPSSQEDYLQQQQRRQPMGGEGVTARFPL